MRDLGIGDRLRNAREAKGLSLEAVEERTRIRAAYLRALEDETFERLPGPAYVKGFLRTYATALGLDPAPLLEALPPEPTATPSLIGVRGVEIPIEPAVPRSPLRRAAMVLGLALLLGAVVVGVVGYMQLRAFDAPVPPEAVAPPPGHPPVPEPPRPAPAPAPSRPAPVELPPDAERERPIALPAGGVTVELRANGESWIRVTADGETAFQGIVGPGTVRRFHGDRRVTVRVGNAPAVEVIVNGRPYTPPPRRQVWEQTFAAP
jgi:cytoskeleton protein RodZ